MFIIIPMYTRYLFVGNEDFEDNEGFVIVRSCISPVPGIRNFTHFLLNILYSMQLIIFKSFHNVIKTRIRTVLNRT